MADLIVLDAKFKAKRSTVPGVVPTVGPSTNHTDGSWSATDIYPGEFFMNLPDEKIWTAVDSGIIQIYPAAGGADTNLGTDDLIVNTTGVRKITQGGAASTDLIEFESTAATPIMQIRGDNKVYIPTGQMAMNAGFANGVELSVNTLNQYPAIQVYHAGYNGMAHLITLAPTGSHCQGYVCNSSNVTGVHKTGFRADITGSTNTNTAFEIVNGDIEFPTAGAGSKVGETNLDLFAFWGATPIVQPTALTAQDTSITHSAPTVADFAIQDLVDSGVGSAFGFATKDEGNTVLQVLLNLQTRVQELENKLSAVAGGSGLIA